MRHAEGIRLAETIVMPLVGTAIRQFTQEDWSILVQQLRTTWDAIDRVLHIHGSRLGPEVMSVLLNLQGHTTSIISIHSTFPDVLGVPDSELKPLATGESAVPLKLKYERAVVQNIEAVLGDAVSPLRILDANGSADASA